MGRSKTKTKAPPFDLQPALQDSPEKDLQLGAPQEKAATKRTNESSEYEEQASEDEEQAGKPHSPSKASAKNSGNKKRKDSGDGEDDECEAASVASGWGPVTAPDVVDDGAQSVGSPKTSKPKDSAAKLKTPGRIVGKAALAQTSENEFSEDDGDNNKSGSETKDDGDGNESINSGWIPEGKSIEKEDKSKEQETVPPPPISRKRIRAQPDPSGQGRRGRPRKNGGICIAENCTKFAVKHCVCEDHKSYYSDQKKAEKLEKKRAEGTFEPCSYQGCKNAPIRAGLCEKHGAERIFIKKCKVKGCETTSALRGLCFKHGGKPEMTKCAVPVCDHLCRRVLCKEHQRELEEMRTKLADQEKVEQSKRAEVFLKSGKDTDGEGNVFKPAILCTTIVGGMTYVKKKHGGT